MKTSMIIAVSAATALFWSAGARGGERAGTVEPDESYQSVLKSIAQAGDRSEFERLVERLTSMGDRDQLVGQLLWYSALDAKSPAARAVVGKVLARIDRPKTPVVRALLRRLDDPDVAVRTNVRELLRGYEDQSATRPPDFSVYREVIEEDVRARREPQASLVRHMYETDAGTALLTMVRANGLRRPAEIQPILWAEHVVSDLMWRRQFGFAAPRQVDAAAMRELEAMSRSRWWWVRLYVAEIVRSNPELGGDVVVQRLAGDGNGLVRRAATRP